MVTLVQTLALARYLSFHRAALALGTSQFSVSDRTLGEIERIEINEAIAAVPIAVIRELGLPEDIVNEVTAHNR